MRYKGFIVARMPGMKFIHGIQSVDGRIKITGFLSEDEAKAYIDKRFYIQR